MLRQLLTSSQIAELLQIPVRTLDDWAYRGEGPPFVRIGRHRRYAPDELERWLASLRRSGDHRRQ